MISIADENDIKSFKSYCRYLLDNKLDEAVSENIKLMKAFELPLVKLLSHHPADELLFVTRQGLVKFLTGLIDGDMKVNEDAIIAGQTDTPVGLNEKIIEPIDIIYSFSSHKLLFLHFLPQYTSDIVLSTNILKVLELIFAETHLQLTESHHSFNSEALKKQKVFPELLIQNDINGVVAYDKATNIIYWNAAMEKICGIAAKDAIGKKIDSMYESFLNKEEKKALKDVLEGKRTFLKEQSYRIKNGYYNIDIVPIKHEGEIIGGVNFIQDISESKAKEFVLKQYQEELQAANADLKESREEIAASNEELIESHASLIKSLHKINNQYQELLELQDELRKSEKKYRLMALNATDIITAYDENGLYSFVSDAVKDVLGIKSEELIGTNPLDLIHPDDLVIIQEASQRLQNSGDPQRFEYRIANAQKEYVWMETIARVTIDPDNPDNPEVQASTRSIQARKAAEIALAQERDQQLKLVINALPALVAYIGADSKYKFVNNAYKEWFGIEPELLIGVDARKFIREKQNFELQGYHERVLKGEKFEAEINVTDKDGALKTGEIRYIPHIADDGEVLGFVVLTIDMSERIKVRDELAQKNKELQQINIDLDNFIYTASHDLKAPILNLEGLFLALDKRFANNYGDKEQMIVRMIYDSIAKFKDTIKNLTEITKVNKDIDSQAGLLSFRQVIDDVLLDIRPDVQEANPDIIVNLQEEQIYYAPQNLRSIIYNLVSNAIKYRSPDRKPVIQISTFTEEDHTILKVQDNGLGMSDYQLPKLFTMFKRLHSHVEGTGIGLYIVKRIITNNGGKIEVESKQDAGTTFTVYFKNKRP